MIRRGRAEGWLKLPISAFRPWAELNGVTFDGVRVGSMPGFEHRGSTVIAEEDLTKGETNPLMVVPKDLILSRESVEGFAKSDKQLKEVLDSVGEYTRTSRGAILVFLLMQATISCPDIPGNIGVTNPLTEYIKFLPEEFLPTFWTKEEQELLVGTTLRSAIRAKMNSLLREFEHIRTATEHISWCQKYWWDDDEGQVTFEDWMHVDAMYRSRALEFPGIGDCMVPCVDMANHSSGDATVALYETDEDGNSILLLRAGKVVKQKDEITITYGDGKGACEMIFSYGFMEDSMDSAKIVFLDLDIPDDDPFRPAKIAVSAVAPGFRIFDNGDRTGWESDFVWLICVNEEDGLGFNFLQTNEGGRELRAFWKGAELEDTSKLRGLLQADALWEVYQLRAITLLQNRIEQQLEDLHEIGSPDKGPNVRDVPWKLAEKLRKLELGLLERASNDLEDQKLVLIESDSVRRYLGIEDEGNAEEDFS